MTLLQNRTALVTGAGSGIGSAIARALAVHGARVIACSRSGSAESVAEDARNAGLQMEAVTFDLEDETAVETAVHEALSHHEALDILVNNAGINIPARVEDICTADADRMFRVNVAAPMQLTRLALPSLRRSPHPRIVNIGSWVDRSPAPGYIAYAASKAALLSFTRGAALELAAENITVNAVCPGNVWTPIWIGADGNRGVRANFESSIQMQPIKRGVDPEEVAAAVVYLVCDDARSITGEAIYVASGLR